MKPILLGISITTMVSFFSFLLSYQTWNKRNWKTKETPTEIWTFVSIFIKNKKKILFFNHNRSLIFLLDFFTFCWCRILFDCEKTCWHKYKSRKERRKERKKLETQMKLKKKKKKKSDISIEIFLFILQHNLIAPAV